MSYICSACHGYRSDVIDSRRTLFRGQPAIRRRRCCTKCQLRWTTYEVVLGGNDLQLRLASLRHELQEATRRCQAAVKAIEGLTGGQINGCEQSDGRQDAEEKSDQAVAIGDDTPPWRA